MPTHGCQRLLIALAMLIALAACTSQRELLIQQGKTPAYAEGYVDGCDSGEKAGGATMSSAEKDASRYGNDSDYKNGWDEAFRKCQADMATKVQEARRRNPQDDK